MSNILLSPAEARVLAALVEKSITTPQYYPMSVNALMMASNQKTCRAPVMSLTEGEVGATLNQLEQRKFVQRDDFGSRVHKWRHHFHNQLLLKPPATAVLATLVLRGPQTVSELRANASGLGGPADLDGMTATLNDLSDRAQPFVVLLPRTAGQKEARYSHTLSGPPAQPADAPAGAEAVAPAAEKTTVAALEVRVRALEARVEELTARLGAAG